MRYSEFPFEDIPKGWEILPIKSLSKKGLNTFIDGDWIESPFITSEGIRLVQTGNIGIGFYKEQGFRYITEETFNLKNCTEVYEKDILICRLADPVGRSCLAPDLGKRMITSVDICILKLKDEIDSRYIVYCLSSDFYLAYMSAISRGSTRDRVSRTQLGNIRIPIPERKTQKQIADFLDKETTRIDTLISKKQKQIELLLEKRQEIITQSVTKGLNLDVKMKDSDVEWIGKIPEHWNLYKIKYISKILRGKFSHRPRNDPDFYDGDYPFIQTGDVSNSTKYIEKYTQTLNENGLSVSKMFPKGTLVMTIAANIGDVSILDFDACFPDSIVGFVPSLKVLIDFLFFMFLCMKDEFIRIAPVNTQGNLNVERVGDMKIPIPSIDEQKDIILKIEEQFSLNNELLDKVDRSIDLLREYRSSLITHAVSGQIGISEYEV